MAIKVAGILGKKVGMTQLFDSKGDVRPVTVLQAGPCVVTQHKLAVKDGYEAAQIGLVEFVKESRLTKPARGHLAKNNLPPVKFMREVPLESDGDGDGALKVGDRVLVEIFEGEKFVEHRRREQGERLPGRGEAASFRRRPQVARVDVSDYGIDRFFGVSFACVQGDAHVGAHGALARHAAQPAGSRGRQGRESAGGGRQCAGTAGRIPGDPEGEEAAQRAPRICGCGYGRSAEGGEASGEEGIGKRGRVARAHTERIWQRLIFTT